MNSDNLTSAVLMDRSDGHIAAVVASLTLAMLFGVVLAVWYCRKLPAATPRYGKLRRRTETST